MYTGNFELMLTKFERAQYCDDTYMWWQCLRIDRISHDSPLNIPDKIDRFVSSCNIFKKNPGFPGGKEWPGKVSY